MESTFIQKESENVKKIKILLSPLDWGMGHTTRIIPIIEYLISHNFEVFVACESGGSSHFILKQQFPQIHFIDLKGYRIHYSKTKLFFALMIFSQIPKILLSIRREHLALKALIKDRHIQLIISDNRYGFFNKNIPSIFITHQLNILAPNLFLEKLIRKINYYFIEHFNRCWVPDFKGKTNLAGKLAHPDILPDTSVHYMGPVSRLKKINAEKEFDFLFLLSGPEPQRTILEDKLLSLRNNHFHADLGKVLLIRGIAKPGEDQLYSKLQNSKYISTDQFKIIAYCDSESLAGYIAASEFIVCRSGYSSLMELISLGKKTILIATPGQTEQEYLAKRMQEQNWAYSFSQDQTDYLTHFNRAKQFGYQLPMLDPMDLTAFLENQFLDLH